MAFRFRRSISIAPGLRVNLGKRGVSLSAGVRGASLTFGSRGTYANVGIPGTGLSYRQKVGGGSEQRRIAITQQRLEREYLRLEQERKRQEALSQLTLSLDRDTGELRIEDRFGGPLSRQDLKFVWDQKRSVILEWLQRQTEEINGDVDLLTSIHQDTPAPNSEPEYETIPFAEEPPEQPIQPEAAPRPAVKQLPPLGFFAKLLRSRRLAYERAQQQCHEENEMALVAWRETEKEKDENYQTALQRYVQLKRGWEQRKNDYETDQADKRAKFPELLRTNQEVMNKTLEDAFNSLSWPRETLVSYQITDQGRQVWLDVNLPEIEDLPQKLATVAATGKKLNVKAKSAKQLQQEYAQHVHGIAFRLVGAVFATLPTADTAVISGFSQRLDSAIGKVRDDYLFSVRVTREQFSTVDFDSLDKVDPVEALGKFELRRKLTATGVLRAIDPFEPGRIET
ncbi:MAG: DUF4236 domain-containing protein [Truepera sp.]|nr:DUF4236 domain-containing protein [Truepera sp.]